MVEFWQREGHSKARSRRAPERLVGGAGQLAELADAVRRGRAAGADIGPTDARALLANALVENSRRYGVDAQALGYGKGYPQLTRPGELLREWRPETEVPMAEALLGRSLSADPRAQVQLREGTGPNGRSIRDLLFMPAGWTPAMPTRQDDVEAAGAYVLRALQKQAERRAPTLADLMTSRGWNGGGTEGHAAKVKAADSPANAELFSRFEEMLRLGGRDSLLDARDLQERAAQ